MSQISYADAGVNIAAGNDAVNRIKQAVHSTFSTKVIGGLGGFGAMYDLSAISRDFKHPVMVQSIDGVGTKSIVARMAGDFSYIGEDLLSACANDILVLGATTLTMLDYIANDKLTPDVIEQIVAGLCLACKANKVSLVGGETAEMPDTYKTGEHDLVGVVTGVVEKDKIIDGKDIKSGDQIYGIASSGLHTNGYSLARKLVFDIAGFKIDSYVGELQQTVAQVLLKPHLNYAKPIHALLDNGIEIKGMAHITGGGLLENIPRVLPKHCQASITLNSWEIPPLFQMLCKLGNLENDEAFRAFNMGIGWVIIAHEEQGERITTAFQALPEYNLYNIGHITAGEGKVKLCR